MKIAVLSDIHSNYHAFKACIDYALSDKICHFLFLGDYVSDCAYSQKTMQLLYYLKRHYQCWFVKGNREEYLLQHETNAEDVWKIPSSATGSLLYTYQDLLKEDLDFFKSMKISDCMRLDGYPAFWYCHGSMDNTRGDLRFTSNNIDMILEEMPVSILVCGHTHMQGIYEKNGKRIVNVGSVGIPWLYHGNAQFAILRGNHDSWDVQLIQLEYNKKQAVLELYESGLMHKANIWAKLVEETLLTGIDRSRKCLDVALGICKEKEGIASWSSLPECYWEEAAKELGIIQ